MGSQLPAVETVSTGTLSTSDGKSYDPEQKKKRRKDPQDVNCKPEPGDEQNYEECQQKDQRGTPFQVN